MHFGQVQRHSMSVNSQSLNVALVDGSFRLTIHERSMSVNSQSLNVALVDGSFRLTVHERDRQTDTT